MRVNSGDAKRAGTAEQNLPASKVGEKLREMLAEYPNPGMSIYEDELPDFYPYDLMFPFSWVDGVRLFPGWDFLRGYLAGTKGKDDLLEALEQLHFLAKDVRDDGQAGEDGYPDETWQSGELYQANMRAAAAIAKAKGESA